MINIVIRDLSKNLTYKNRSAQVTVIAVHAYSSMVTWGN